MPYKDLEKARISSRERTARWRQRNPDYVPSEEQRERKRQKAREYYLENIDHQLEQKREYRKKVRTTVLQKYGGVCVCCNEAEEKFLGIDHILNDGKEDRKSKGTGYGFYLYLYKTEPDHNRYQVMCHNCNFAKGHYGSCPHLDAP